mmetsp:Transcript_142316/g.248175  ORF Transcript_142316/g.248175 Transcript_142316/m.248175 type:complete len:270 (-) Transcript_142316:505-1314(-)
MQRKVLLGALGSLVGCVAFWSLQQPHSPFRYPELDKCIQQRRVQQAAALHYVSLQQQRMQQLQAKAEEEAQFYGARWWRRHNISKQLEADLAKMEGETRAGLEDILYGCGPGEHKLYMDQYGCAKWTEAALQVVAQHSPLIEIGAGRGQWAKQLHARKADIIAFDDMSSVPLPHLPFAFPVQKGGPTQLPAHPTRTLFLCYPPPGPMARDCLASYPGKKLLYVGEGEGGVNADSEFFRQLEQGWQLESLEPLEPLGPGCERLWVLQKKC